MHESFTVGLKVGGNIRLDHCAAEGKNCSYNEFGRRHDLLVTGHKWKNEQVDKPIGVLIFFHRSYKGMLF